MTSFENFLQEVCFTIYPSVLDDDMPDFFDDWIANLDNEDLLRYGQLYGENTFVEGRNAQKDIYEMPGFEGTLKALDNIKLHEESI